MEIIQDKLKVYSLTGRITEELMLKAFKAVKKNRGAAGIDKVSISMYESNLKANLLSLMKELKNGTYQATPLRRVHIEKGTRKMLAGKYGELTPLRQRGGTGESSSLPS